MNSLVAYDEDSVGMSPLLASAAVNYTASTFFPPNSTEGNMEMDDLDGDVLYQVPLGIVVMLSTFYGGISLAAVTGNGLVLWVVSVSRRMRTVTNMFIANLALADIIIGLLAIPFQFQAALLQRWNLWHFMCSFCPFVQVLSVNVSVFTLSAIAVDRYRAVLYPLSARASKRKATIFIVIIWSLSILIALPTELDFSYFIAGVSDESVAVVKHRLEILHTLHNRIPQSQFQEDFPLSYISSSAT